MKALSIRQPWAWAILHAGKDVENRDWRTRVRGRVLIHASATNRLAEFEAFYATRRAISDRVPGLLGWTHIDRDSLVYGALIGSVEIVDCVNSSASPWFFGDFGFVLREPRLFQRPIPWRGSLGFFDVPDEVIARAA